MYDTDRAAPRRATILRQDRPSPVVLLAGLGAIGTGLGYIAAGCPVPGDPVAQAGLGLIAGLGPVTCLGVAIAWESKDWLRGVAWRKSTAPKPVLTCENEDNSEHHNSAAVRRAHPRRIPGVAHAGNT